MRRIILAVAACAIGLGLAGEASAKPVGHRVGGVHRRVEFGRGIRERGRGFHHHRWGRRVWSPIYHRYHYYDLDCGGYFYYDAGCYHPCN